MDVRFTRLGRLNIVRSGMEEATVAAAIVADLREVLDAEDGADLLDFVFHCPEIGGQMYFVTPGDGFLEADSCELEDGGILDEGPFAGKRVMFPGPASDDDAP